GNQRGVVAIGNVDVTIFERATRAEIEAEVRRCIDTVGHRSRFVLSTSCELPPRQPGLRQVVHGGRAGVRPLGPDPRTATAPLAVSLMPLETRREAILRAATGADRLGRSTLRSRPCVEARA